MKQAYFRKTLILIVFVSALLYINSLSNTFVYDDVYIITENYLIKSPGNVSKLFQRDYLLLSGELSYRPVVTLTYFIDYAIWQLNPLGYHLTNIILNTINVFLFYCLITKICKNHTVSLFATLFLLSHPILTETVNAVCYREDILASIFFLLAFIFFIKVRVPFSQKENSLQQTTTRFIFYYFLSCASYCLALFSKEMAITLPIILVLFDLLYVRQDSIKALSTSPGLIRVAMWIFFYAGYIVVTGFYLFIRFVTFKNIFKTITVSPSNVVTMIKVVASYIKLLFIPLNLNADYCVPYSRYLGLSFILSSLFIASAVIVIIRLYRHNKPITFFNLWFFITLLPVLGIIPIGNSMAERYLYIPIMGFCGATGFISANYLSQRKGLPVVVGTILLGMQIGVIYRNGVWQDDTTLWSYTYKREPNSARACSNLGNTLFKSQRYEDAILLYKKSLTFPYSYPFIHYNLAVAYEKVGQVDRAIEAYKASITRHNDNTLAYNNLGTIYHKQGLYGMAIDSYKQALTNNPYFPLSHNNLGNTYEQIGDSEKALVEYEEALKIDDAYADAHNNLGAVYLKKGISDKALVEFKKATQLNPDHRDAHYNLGIAYAGKGLYVEAIHELNLAIKYNPADYSAYRDLGILYFQYEKDIKKALSCLHESLKLTHDPVETEKVKEMIDTIKKGQVF